MAEGAFPACRAGKGLERLVLRARADAVQPGPAVFAARGGEGGAGQLLGIQAVRALLRRIAAYGQGAGQRFGRAVVAEAGLIFQFHGILLGGGAVLGRAVGI
ncbi:hypothetical protein G6F61_014967 [Rhizopus arrhizus]|nr:hypothetical protein G6F61_014967 [Rhizopus arrhizus]